MVELFWKTVFRNKQLHAQSCIHVLKSPGPPLTSNMKPMRSQSTYSLDNSYKRGGKVKEASWPAMCICIFFHIY